MRRRFRGERDQWPTGHGTAVSLWAFLPTKRPRSTSSAAARLRRPRTARVLSPTNQLRAYRSPEARYRYPNGRVRGRCRRVNRSSGSSGRCGFESIREADSRVSSTVTVAQDPCLLIPSEEPVGEPGYHASSAQFPNPGVNERVGPSRPGTRTVVFRTESASESAHLKSLHGKTSGGGDLTGEPDTTGVGRLAQQCNPRHRVHVEHMRCYMCRSGRPI